MNYITPVATTRSWVGDWDITIKKNILQKVASQRFVYEFCGPDDLFTKAFPDNRLPMLKSDEAWSKADDSATSLGLSPVKCAPYSFQGDKNGRPKLRRPPRSDSELPTKKTDIPLWFFILYVCACLNFVFRIIAVNFGGLLLVTPYYAAPTEYISRPPCY